jgi:phosphoglycolate phosphatase-like HAD superfamily hydrolase
MVEAGQRLFGVSDLFGEVSFAGSVDPVIVASALSLNGLPPSPRRVGLLKAAYLRALRRRIVDNRGGLLPGVTRLVEESAARAPIGLLTGNWWEGAALKLGRFQLWTPFLGGFHAFGGDAPDRDGLMPVALRRAWRAGHRPSRVLVIGDTPNDVNAARKGHRNLGRGAPELVTVAVRTGFATPEELEACAPDLMVDDLEKGRDAVLALL